MTRATQNSLPAGTVLGKSFEYGVEVNLGTQESPNWQTVRRMFNFQLTPTPTTTDAQTYDDEGAANAAVTGWSFSLAFATHVNRSGSTGLYLPEIEALRARTLPSAKGIAAQIGVRWFHQPDSAGGGVPNPTDAGQGVATVASVRANIAPDGAIETLNWTLTGVGAYEEIANPFAGYAETVPVLQSVSPADAASGALVTITGAGFSGVTDVTFDGIDAVPFSVMSGSTIIATVPTDDAGDVPVVVTNGAGASAAFTYTRGA